MSVSTLQRRTSPGVRAEHEVTLSAPAPAAALDPLAAVKSSHTSMRAVLQGLEARKHTRGFTEHDRLRLLRTRAVDGLLSDTLNLVKSDAEAINYLRWRARTAESEADTMQGRRPPIWMPGRRRAADEQIREKRAMAQEANSFATSIEVDSGSVRRSLSGAPATAGTPEVAAPQPSHRHSRPATAPGIQGRVDRGLRGAGQFTALAHREAGITLAAQASPQKTSAPAQTPAAQEPPALAGREGSERHLKRLNDFLAPLESRAGGSGMTADQEAQLLRGRRVRRILETAVRGTSNDAQVVDNLAAIRQQAEGQLRSAQASPAATDRAALAARIRELREVVKDCGTYAGFLTAGT